MNRFLIRSCDVLLSITGLMVLSPFFIVVASWILFDDFGPVIFMQSRVGKDGADFKLMKFRTMRVNAERSGQLTVGVRDPRITKAGYWLRKYKLDELPQLLNVLLGSMSLVGPRPEVRRYVDRYTHAQSRVLSVRPGITDEASIAYRDENKILSEVDDPERYYIEQILPDKIRLNMRYIENQSLKSYFSIIFRTLSGIIN